MTRMPRVRRRRRWRCRLVVRRWGGDDDAVHIVAADHQAIAVVAAAGYPVPAVAADDHPMPVVVAADDHPMPAVVAAADYPMPATATPADDAMPADDRAVAPDHHAVASDRPVSGPANARRGVSRPVASIVLRERHPPR